MNCGRDFASEQIRLGDRDQPKHRPGGAQYLRRWPPSPWRYLCERGNPMRRNHLESGDTAVLPAGSAVCSSESISRFLSRHSNVRVLHHKQRSIRAEYRPSCRSCTRRCAQRSRRPHSIQNHNAWSLHRQFFSRDQPNCHWRQVAPCPLNVPSFNIIWQKSTTSRAVENNPPAGIG